MGWIGRSQQSPVAWYLWAIFVCFAFFFFLLQADSEWNLNSLKFNGNFYLRFLKVPLYTKINILCTSFFSTAERLSMYEKFFSLFSFFQLKQFSLFMCFLFLLRRKKNLNLNASWFKLLPMSWEEKRSTALATRSGTAELNDFGSHL